MPTPISAIVLTLLNEAANVADCLASLQWADEVGVVDSLSSDATPQIAQSLAARVIQHSTALTLTKVVEHACCAGL